MPAIKVTGGYKIKRATGGMYPKVYKTLEAANTRIQEMHMFDSIQKARKGKK